jgi:hypothetical protein
MPQQAPFDIQTRLTQIAMAVKPMGMIADRVLPRVPVEAEKFTYTKFITAESFTIPDTRIGRSSEPNTVEFGATDVTDSTQDHGLADFVPKKDVKNAEGTNFDPMAVATESTALLVELAREQRAASLIFSLNTYAASLRTTLSGTSQWSDYTNSDPVEAIDAAVDSMLIRPNVLVLGRQTWRKLRKHPKVIAAVLGQRGVGAAEKAAGKVGLEAVAELLELDEIIVGEAFYNTAAKGQAASYSRLWGAHAALLHINRNVRSARAAIPTFGFTAEWGGRRVRTIDEPKKGVDGGTSIHVVEQVKELVSFQELGYFFQNAVA